MPDEAPVAPPDVVCTDLAKSFPARNGPLQAVAPLSLRFAAGRTTALVGPSGCGKSTILRLVAGLDAPSAGSVAIGGETPAGVRAGARLSMAFQDPSLLPWRSLRGNVALARKLARQPRDRRAVDALIALVGLEGFEAARPAALSGGMRQRAAIARCLVTEPELLLLDEPFGAVDDLTRKRLNRDLPALWQRRGTTTLMVTHSVPEAVLLADRVLVLSPRPARVLADIAVPFAHPRAPDLPRSPAFREIAESVAAALAGEDDAPAAATAAE